MRKLIALAVAASFIGMASTAAAATHKLKFEGAAGDAIVVTFNSASMTTSDDKGHTGTYTWDAASRKVCVTNAQETRCGTFAAIVEKVGDKTTSTDDKGVTHTVTLLAIE